MIVLCKPCHSKFHNIEEKDAAEEVYTYIWGQNLGGVTECSQTEIASACDISLAKVKEAVASLELTQRIAVERRYRQTSRYRFPN